MPVRSVLAALALALAGTAAAGQDAGWQSYQGAGFTISYPAGWKVNPAFTDRGYGYYQGESDDVRSGIAFSPAGDIAPGTDLQSDQLVLAVEPARPGDLCQARGFLVDPPPDNDTQILVDKPDAAQTIAQAGDLYTVEHDVIVVSHAPCIAVQYYIVTSRGGANRVDRKALLGLLNHIAATLKPAP